MQGIEQRLRLIRRSARTAQAASTVWIGVEGGFIGAALLSGHLSGVATHVCALVTAAAMLALMSAAGRTFRSDLLQVARLARPDELGGRLPRRPG